MPAAAQNHVYFNQRLLRSLYQHVFMARKSIEAFLSRLWERIFGLIQAILFQQDNFYHVSFLYICDRDFPSWIVAVDLYKLHIVICCHYFVTVKGYMAYYFFIVSVANIGVEKKGAELFKRGDRIFWALFFGSICLLLFSLASPVRFGIVKNRIESLFLIEKAGFGKYSTHELGTLHSRYISYEMILKEIKKKPLLGYGLGESIQRSSSGKLQNIFEKTVDSSYLVYLHKGGIVLLFSFLAMICSILIKIARKAKNANRSFEVFLSTSILFALLNTMGLAIQDLILYSGLQICTICFIFALVVQWESIFNLASRISVTRKT